MIYLFFMSRMLTMTLTESTNICFVSIRVACTVKLNIKENFLGNNVFPANVYIVNGLQSEIKRPITWRFFFSEGRMDSCYSVLTLGNPWTYVKQGWYYKVWQPIINPPELLLKLLEADFEIYLEWSWQLM